MPKTAKTLTDESEAFLKALDDAPLGAILKDRQSKEWMETLVLRALTKLETARYHRANLRRLVRRNERRFKQHVAGIDENPGGLSKHMTATHAGVLPAGDIAHELDALLAAIRSSIDFGGRVLGLHLGMDRKTSITKVVKAAKNPANHPFAFLLAWEPWIVEIQHYRDECTHYRTLRLQTGYEAVYRHGVLAWSLRPVVIPKRHGHDRPDTRMDRMMEDPVKDPVGLNRLERSMVAKATDGTILTVEHSLEYVPAEGYIRVEQFSARHVRKLERFLAAVFKDAAAANFMFQSGTPVPSGTADE